MPDTLLTRFLRYVQIDTESHPANRATSPSSPQQWDLLRLLERELRDLGASDVQLTKHGYVFATIAATTARTDVPTVAFFAHVDTAPDFSGHHVKPIVHQNYQGQSLRLPDDKTQVLDPSVVSRIVDSHRQRCGDDQRHHAPRCG